jgi:acyl-CoA reductase-like NAD-dependent aldehyde dehydrogenase
MAEIVKNFINGEFVASQSKKTTDVINPATMELIARTPVGHENDVNPAMVPFWFWPFAVIAGNTYIIKPSELVPLVQTHDVISPQWRT